MSITLSDSAAARVNTFLANRGKGFGLRLGVRTSGCSGMAYVLEFVDEPTPEDIVFEDKGVKVVVDGKSLQFLDGTQLDFVKGTHVTRILVMVDNFFAVSHYKFS